MSKKYLIVIRLIVLLILAWAPWMAVSSPAKLEAIYTHEVLIGACQNVKVSWLPFGRFLSNCEGGRYIFLWW